MLKTLHSFFLSLLLIGLVPTLGLASAASDSTIVYKTKNYLRPCFYFNHYSTPQRRNVTVKQYRFAQNNLGFYLPVHTSSWFNQDSTSLATLQIVAVADFIQYKPQLYYLNESYQIGRLSGGLRIFYGNGKKNVFYFSLMPFVSHEFQSVYRRVPRFTSAFIYSRTVNPKFGYRLGITRTYSFGRSLLLPILGIRVGPLDKLHFNIQLPRNISLDFPLSKKTWCSVFSKAMGGIYNVETEDSLIGPKGTLATLRRFELLSGAQFNFRTGPYISFYVSTGFATRRYVTYSIEDSPRRTQNKEISLDKIPNSLFVSFGLSIRFGKSKQVYNNSTMYDIFDLNTLNKAGTNEMGPIENDIPSKPEKSAIEDVKSLKYKDVEDLVSEEY